MAIATLPQKVNKVASYGGKSEAIIEICRINSQLKLEKGKDRNKNNCIVALKTVRTEKHFYIKFCIHKNTNTYKI